MPYVHIYLYIYMLISMHLKDWSKRLGVPCEEHKIWGRGNQGMVQVRFKILGQEDLKTAQLFNKNFLKDCTFFSLNRKQFQFTWDLTESIDFMSQSVSIWGKKCTAFTQPWFWSKKTWVILNIEAIYLQLMPKVFRTSTRYFYSQ